MDWTLLKSMSPFIIIQCLHEILIAAGLRQQADVTVEELEEQANNEVDDDLLREAYASLEHYP